MIIVLAGSLSFLGSLLLIEEVGCLLMNHL